jgi:hypothetical protein
MGWNKDGSFTLDDETFRPDFTLSPAEMKKRDRERKREFVEKLANSREIGGAKAE